MKKKTKGILIGLLVLGGVGMFIMSNDEPVVKQEPKQEVVQEEEIKEEVKPVTSKEEEEEVKNVLKQTFLQSFIKRVQTTAENSFDHSNVEYNEESNTIIMSVATNGLARDAMKVKLGLSDKANWDQVKESVDSTLKAIQEELDKMTLSDVSVSIIVLNDENLDKVLYVNANGISLYDAVE